MAAATPDSSVPPIEPAPAAPPAPMAEDPYAASQPYSAAPYSTPSYPTAPYPTTPYPTGPHYGGGYYAPAGPPRGLAIASLVTGIAGVLFSFVYGLGLFPSIAGIITGHLARKRQPEARGFWIAGLVCGYVGLAISVLWGVLIILALVFFAAIPADTGVSPIDIGN